MSEFALYRQPVVLDTIKHRNLRLKPLGDHSMAAGMHACFLAAAEFTHAAREFVIVFVRNQVDGKEQVQPVVLLGVVVGENLFVEPKEGSPWDARYVPAYIRRYPFWTMQADGLDAPAVMFDAWWQGFSETEGEPLYKADGQPAARLAETIGFMEQFDIEAARTVGLCQRLVELGLLREMAANITLPDQSTLALNGFLTIDDAKLRDLPDAAVLELHRNGALGLLHAHLSSLGNLQALLDRKARRMAGPSN